MNNLRLANWLAGASLALSVGFGFAWLGGTESWPLRAAALGGGLALAVGSVFVLERTQRRARRAAQLRLEALCRFGAQDAYAGSIDGGLPPLPPQNPWAGAVDQVRDAMVRLHRRVQDLEQAQAAIEIRSRRAATEAARIRRIFSGLADPILAIDNYDDVVLANRSAEQLFRIEPEKSETKALAQLVRCQKLVQLLTATRRRKTASQRVDEVEIADDQGQSHWYRATAVKLGADRADDYAEGADEVAVAVLRDIGDQKTLQKRNAEFVSSVSHEMKTPLAGIKAYVELLADGDAEDEATREEFLSVINGQTDRLQRLVDNLLNLARIEAGVVNVSKESRSLNELLEEALHVVQPSAEAKNIELRSDLSPLYLGVVADRDMLLQAAINLLSNAVKYTPGGGKVTLRSRLVDSMVRFEVQDTGVGLSEEDCRRVFDKFYRVKKDKEMAAGTGLGLALAKHIVEDVHGGKLAVESALGQGSTFAVTLPCAGKEG